MPPLIRRASRYNDSCGLVEFVESSLESSIRTKLKSSTDLSSATKPTSLSKTKYISVIIANILIYKFICY